MRFPAQNFVRGTSHRNEHVFDIVYSRPFCYENLYAQRKTDTALSVRIALTIYHA
jgi:hypothetical protein